MPTSKGFAWRFQIGAGNYACSTLPARRADRNPEVHRGGRLNISLQPGDRFNPYQMFTGLFIPEGLARSGSISAGAKLAWGRLGRYAGADGKCYPAMKTLGAEIGVGERQAQRYVAELERVQLIRRVSRFAAQAQTSNAFEFLWHDVFLTGVTDMSGEGVSHTSPREVTDPSPKESQIEESHLEEKHGLRLSGHESQKARFAPGLREARCKQYPHLQKALAEYMQEPDSPLLLPSDRVVVDVMDAAQPASELEVIESLRYLYEERGLRPGTRNGPRHFSWFRTVVDEYFQQKRERQFPAPAEAGGGLAKIDFDAMTDAIEIVGAEESAPVERRT